jgi:hypothetical protein
MTMAGDATADRVPEQHAFATNSRNARNGFARRAAAPISSHLQG